MPTGPQFAIDQRLVLRVGAAAFAVVIVAVVALVQFGSDNSWRAHTKAAESAFFDGDYAGAEQRFVLAVDTARQLGDTDPRYATALRNLASFYFFQGRYDDAEPMIAESIRIQEVVLGTAHPAVAASLYDLATLYTAREDFAAAEPLVQRALSITRRTLGADDRHMADGFDLYANILDGLGADQQASAMRARAQSIALGEAPAIITATPPIIPPVLTDPTN